MVRLNFENLSKLKYQVHFPWRRSKWAKLNVHTSPSLLMPLIRKKHSFVWSFDVCKFKVHKCVTYRVGIDSISFSHIQFTSVQSLSCVQLFATPWTAARQASLSIANSQSLLRLMSIESAMPSNHLILCHPLLLPPSIYPCIRVFSNE